MIQSDGGLAADVCLQVGHQKSGGDGFSKNFADDQAECSLAEIVFAEVEKVEVIASHFPSLQAKTGIFEGLRLGMDLREQPGLHLLGDFEFLGNTALRFKLLGECAALGFDP